MVLPDSHRISRVPWYSGYRPESAQVSVTGLSPSLAGFSKPVHLPDGLVTPYGRSYNPPVLSKTRPRFGLFRVRSPLLAESLLFSFPPGTEMVHFSGLARARLCVQRAVAGVYPAGFPHSDIPGSKRAYRSPRLFAVNHVLHRLLAPRHPPYALSSLTTKLTQLVSPLGKKQKDLTGQTSTRYVSVVHASLTFGAYWCIGPLPAVRVARERRTFCCPFQLSKNKKNPAPSAGLCRVSPRGTTRYLKPFALS